MTGYYDASRAFDGLFRFIAVVIALFIFVCLALGYALFRIFG